MDVFPACAAATVAGVAAIVDMRSRRIPNWLTAAALAVGVGLNAWQGGFSGALVAFGGAGLGLALLLPFYMLRAIGGGDVKLLAGIGAIVGAQALVSVALYGALVGGVISLGVLLSRGRWPGLMREAVALRQPPRLSGLKAPYGVAIAVGLLLSLILPSVVG